MTVAVRLKVNYTPRWYMRFCEGNNVINRPSCYHTTWFFSCLKHKSHEILHEYRLKTRRKHNGV